MDIRRNYGTKNMPLPERKASDVGRLFQSQEKQQIDIDYEMGLDKLKKEMNRCVGCTTKMLD
jgi:hypothetical protein